MKSTIVAVLAVIGFLVVLPLLVGLLIGALRMAFRVAALAIFGYLVYKVYRWAKK